MPARKEAPAPAPGMMSAAQQKNAWKLVYRLRDLDADRSAATVGERMVGAIRKVFNMDVQVGNPFQWLDAANGGMLIEELKRYVRSAERKKGAS